MSSQSLTVTTASAEETEALGAVLLPYLPQTGVVACHGDLAAGKTCFIRGLTRAAKCTEDFSSPTFTIINEYRGDRTFYHVDLYRIAPEEIADLGHEDIFDPQSGLALIEWAERAQPLLPEKRLDLRLAHAGHDLRTIEIENHDLLTKGWEDALRPTENRS